MLAAGAALLALLSAQATAQTVRDTVAGELVYYYSGDFRIDLWVAHDELALHAQPGATRALATVLRAYPGAKIQTEPQTGRQWVRFEKPLASRAALVERAQEFRDAGWTPQAVLYPPGAPERGSINRHTLWNQFSLQLKDPGALPEILERYQARVIREIEYAPHTYVLETADPDPLHALLAANALYERGEAVFASPILTLPHAPRQAVDPLFGQQFDLENTGQAAGAIPGNDVRAVGAWNVATGAGINIAIVDDGVEEVHEDLAPNARTALSINLVDGNDNPAPVHALDNHGTSVAGVAAAAGFNNFGVRGMAYEAGIAGVRLLGGRTDVTTADAMNHRINAPSINDVVHVSNNSWGPPDRALLVEGPGPLTLLALENGITNGRNGLGTVYVWAAGNGRDFGDHANYDGFANHRGTIAVGASGANGRFSYYSEACACLLVNAVSSYHGAGGEVYTYTTDRTAPQGYEPAGNYTTQASHAFGGTSHAAPLVSGAVALMLEANPLLTWRDVQHVLVNSATHIDLGSLGWITNDAGLRFSHDYGFGRLNAERAVIMARDWVNVPGSAPPLTASAAGLAMAIPDNSPQNILHTLNIVAPSDFIIEHADVVVHVTHPRRSDLEFDLVSPDGVISTLGTMRNVAGADYVHWRFGSVVHWGGRAGGAWDLMVRDGRVLNAGVLDSWSITVHGFLLGIDASAGPNGSIAPVGRVPVDYGGDKLFTMTPATGYHVAEVFIDGVAVGPMAQYRFEDVYTDHEIEAQFAINTYTITASAGVGGVITPEGVQTVEHGSSQAYTLTPAPGFELSDLRVDGVSLGALNAHTFSNIVQDHTIHATFVPEPHTIATQAGAGGRIFPEGPVDVFTGDTVSFAIIPASGFYIDEVLVDGAPIGPAAAYTFFDVDGAHSVAATFSAVDATVSVTTLNDVLDGNTASLTDLLANRGSDGQISLREAIRAVRNTAGHQRIVFSVSGTINMQNSGFDTLTGDEGMTIDGGGVITLNGSALSGFATGIHISGKRNVVRGLRVTGSPSSGVLIQGAGAMANAVLGCEVGVGGVGVAGSGLQIEHGSHNLLGGPLPEERNASGSNSVAGVAINGTSAMQNLVIGNRIGVSPDGHTVRPNAGAGVVLFFGAHHNVIGGAEAGMRNIISGNVGSGVRVQNDAHDNHVRGNYIGTNGDGVFAMPNGDWGIRIFSNAPGNVAGGGEAGAGNVVSGNTGGGIAIHDAGSHHARIQGNLIGVNAAGTAAGIAGKGM
jgi:kexin